MTFLKTSTDGVDGLLPLTVIGTYAAVISQTGTDAPVATLFDGSIGNAVWAYVDATHYTLTLTGAFANVIYNNGVDINGNYLYRIDDDTMGYYAAVAPTGVPILITAYTPVVGYVQNFTATGGTDITLAWDAVPDTDGYLLEFSYDQTTWQSLYDGTGTSYTHTPLIGGETFYYRISAYAAGYNNGGYSFANATTVIP
jgi:hypothetical protein